MFTPELTHDSSLSVLLRLTPVAVSSLQIIAAIAVVFFLLKLGSVLVPVSFAVFLAFLVEPVLSAIVHFPETVASNATRWCPGKKPPTGGTVTGSDLMDLSSARSDEFASEAGESAAIPSEYAGSLGRSRRSVMQRTISSLHTTWAILSILICVLCLLGLLTSVVLGFYASLNACDWSKYASSSKFKNIQVILEKIGVNETNWKDVAKKYEGDLTSIASTMVQVLGHIVITLLLFFFCLVAILPGIRQKLPASRMRRMMQRYLLCKSLTSLIVSVAVMISLWVLKVDLVLVFGMATFFCNFIPNIGSFFAIILPAPLVYLTPNRTLEDVVLVVVVPFIIHNTLGCVLEPQLMQAGLDLHPLTVVVSLTFWGAVWGVCGMILSVPITCGVRLLLQESQHPQAEWMVSMMDNPLGTGVRRTPGGVTPSSSGHDSTD